MPDLAELDQLLTLLREHNVRHYKTVEVELTLGPVTSFAPTEEAGEPGPDKDDEIVWRGMTRAQARMIGAES